MLLNELRRDREEQTKKWDEQAKRWDEQDKRWEENRKEIKDILEEIKYMNRRIELDESKYESGICAIGARWGIYSEESFRNGLRAILEESLSSSGYQCQ